MKAALFYISKNAAMDRQEIVLADGTKVYLRAYLSMHDDAQSMLEKASPDHDETVLNSIELDDE